MAFVALKLLMSREFNHLDGMFVKGLNPLVFMCLFVNDFSFVDLIYDKNFSFVEFIIAKDFNSLDFIFVAFVKDSFVTFESRLLRICRCF